MENCDKHLKLSLLFLLITLPHTLTLQVGFYRRSCPNAEATVRRMVQQRFRATRSAVAPALLRMHFHDCFVRGCDASILIDSTPNNRAEKAAGPNLSIREFAFIDQIKSRLEATCPQTVSCADIIALATRDAVALAGGPRYNIPTGRRDGLVSRASEVNLPGPTFTVSQSQQAFRAKGLNLNDMVVLLGGHTIGVAHCNFFRSRLFNFQGSGAPDRTMNTTLLTRLRGICGPNPNVDPPVFLDQGTPFVVDNQYYNQIRNGRGILQIDQELALSPLSSGMVSNLARNNGFFSRSFANAMIKMGNIQVLEGRAGEIRRNCRAFNMNN